MRNLFLRSVLLYGNGLAVEGVNVLIAVGIRLANHDALLGLQINIGEVHILLAFLSGGHACEHNINLIGSNRCKVCGKGGILDLLLHLDTELVA